MASRDIRSGGGTPHRGTRADGTAAARTEASDDFAPPPRRRGALALLAFLLLVLLLGLWTYGKVKQSLANGQAAALEALRDSHAGALDLWLASGAHVNDERFTALLDAARPGGSGEAYVFDAQGRMLSRSRHAEQLHGLGLGTDAAATPYLRDPGGEATQSDHSDPDSASWPATRLAAAALAARSAGAPPRHGAILEPYRNYVGHEVVGAWKWLPDHDIGVAVEIGAEEAYAPLQYFHVGFAALLVSLALVWFSFFLPPAALRRLFRRSPGLGKVGPYTIKERIGEGGMSNIYLARHALLERPAAVKILKKHATTDEMIARFEREVQLASQLSHPNTIEIYDYGRTDNGGFYYAMEYLEGLSLADLVERYGPLPPGRAAYLLRQVCASLNEAHSKGLVHRDIKPQNIMTCRLGGEHDVVKLLDFGLVKKMDTVHTRELTRSLRVLGTPQYMAPERIRSPAEAGLRSDIYSLGAVGFYVITGQHLFISENDPDLTYQVLHVEARRAAACAPQAVPAKLDDLLARCLAKEPEARPASAAEVAEALERVLAERPWTKRDADAWWRKHWVDEHHPERRIVAG
jgi:serine/threonine-protein kinase